MPYDLLLIAGPTATGKSELALRLARRLGGRIINADSVQVYRGLETGSFKPPEAARRRIQHYLVDVADPAEPFSAGRFARMAGEAVQECHAAGALPIVAGGTGLYVRALLHGIAPMPPRDEDLRKELYARAAVSGSEALHAELAQVDPVAAARLGTKDLQRIVRALEVASLTGRPLSEHLREHAFSHPGIPALKIGLTMDRSLLKERIDTRVEGMFAAGLVQEVGALLTAGVPAGANALKALGYREALAHLQGGADLAATIDLVKRNTRRYARRQVAWFRREPGIRWLDVGSGLDKPERAVLDLFG